MEAFLIKSAISMAVLLLVYKLFLEKEKMHRFNRFYLLFSLVFSLWLPFINIPVYVEAESFEPTQLTANEPVNLQEQKSVGSIREIVWQDSNNDIEAATIKTNYWPEIILYTYCFITLLLALRFIWNISQFLRLAHKNQTIRYQTANLVLLPHKTLPHTFLNFIFINGDEYRAQTIVNDLYVHELAHVNQKHTLDVLFIEVLKTLMWFNPLLYFYKRAIQLNHEFLADEAVVSKENVTTYQNTLLQVASGSHCIALASNLNFSVTKKRFIMMTKTTPKRKSRLLKLATAFIAVGITYFISTKTVTYAKGTEAPSFFQQFNITKDTIAGDARRDEYFSGVKITIQDSLRNVFVNAPYEKLTDEQKRFYLSYVPEKKGNADGVSEEDYKFSLEQEDSHFYIDNKKISREEFLKHDRKEFASSGYRGHGGTMVDGKLQMIFQMYYYTYPYYNKHIKHINDHYPKKACQISISEKPIQSGYSKIEKTGDEVGKSDKEVMDMRQETTISAASYSFDEESAKTAHNRDASFPGGKEAFDKYIQKNIDFGSITNKDYILIGYTINTDGSVSDVKLYGNVDDKELDSKVKKVFENSPKWVPQQKEGKPVVTNTTYYYKKTK